MINYLSTTTHTYTGYVIHPDHTHAEFSSTQRVPRGEGSGRRHLMRGKHARFFRTHAPTPFWPSWQAEESKHRYRLHQFATIGKPRYLGRHHEAQSTPAIAPLHAPPPDLLPCTDLTHITVLDSQETARLLHPEPSHEARLEERSFGWGSNYLTYLRCNVLSRSRSQTNPLLQKCETWHARENRSLDCTRTSTDCVERALALPKHRKDNGRPHHQTSPQSVRVVSLGNAILILDYLFYRLSCRLRARAFASEMAMSRHKSWWGVPYSVCCIPFGGMSRIILRQLSCSNHLASSYFPAMTCWAQI
ncbi:hypothetical protein LY78DRAFT_492341 [Colletotrichum sublineola]|nr:hypothetical protein LY78DRAFT_492341 [Colletotrichum sublineola]